MPDLFVVVGPPAVGKSTASRAVCARFPRSVHLPVDDLRLMVRSGLSLPRDDWPADLVEQVGLARRTALDMAGRYRAAGFVVVVDDFADPGLLAEYDVVRDDPRARRVLLRPTRSEAHRRSHAREGESAARDYIDGGIRLVYDVLDGGGGDALARAGWRVLDTTTMSAEETASAILDGGVPGGR